MEREVGGGIRMGNTCKPMAVSFQCMTKFTTNKKKKESNFLNLIKNIFIKTTLNTIINSKRLMFSPEDWKQGKDALSQHSCSM